MRQLGFQDLCLHICSTCQGATHSGAPHKVRDDVVVVKQRGSRGLPAPLVAERRRVLQSQRWRSRFRIRTAHIGKHLLPFVFLLGRLPLPCCACADGQRNNTCKEQGKKFYTSGKKDRKGKKRARKGDASKGQVKHITELRTEKGRKGGGGVWGSEGGEQDIRGSDKPVRSICLP